LHALSPWRHTASTCGIASLSSEWNEDAVGSLAGYAFLDGDSRCASSHGRFSGWLCGWDSGKAVLYSLMSRNWAQSAIALGACNDVCDMALILRVQLNSR
jgi:hypothetical protein